MDIRSSHEDCCCDFDMDSSRQISVALLHSRDGWFVCHEKQVLVGDSFSLIQVGEGETNNQQSGRPLEKKPSGLTLLLGEKFS